MVTTTATEAAIAPTTEGRRSVPAIATAIAFPAATATGISSPIVPTGPAAASISIIVVAASAILSSSSVISTTEPPTSTGDAEENILNIVLSGF